MVNIEVPYNFTPRSYQRNLFKAFMTSKYKRFFYVWHRRGGKDLCALNLTIWYALQHKGTYWHLLPKYTQARKAIWDGMDNDGRKFLDYFPPELVKNVNKVEMKIEFVNGSIWQLQGSDNYNDLLSTNPSGVVFSEYGYSDPNAWIKIQPILEANDGWALFETTPNGENHAYDLYERATQLDYWFTETLRVDETEKPDGDPIVTEEQIELIRGEGMDEDKIQQEYYCSWTASLIGAYYGDQIRRAEEEGRITSVDLTDGYKVWTWWDIGASDNTSIWVYQCVGNQIRIINHYKNNGEPPEHYARVLQDMEKELKYNYGGHNLPHDAKHKKFGAGNRSAKDWLEAAGLENVKVHPRTNDVNLDINTVRMIFSRCVFDKEKTYGGVQGLKSYRKVWNDLRKSYDDKPYHDWASDDADAFRGLCTTYKEEYGVRVQDNIAGELTFNSIMKNKARNRNRYKIDRL